MKELRIPNPFGGRILHIEETSSTMDAARQQVLSPSLSGGESAGMHGTVISTSLQTAGRGRLDGRSWFSPSGQSLMFTLILSRSRIPVPVTSLSIRSALALVAVLRYRFGLESCIKWPNDVQIQGKKISGILCESAGDDLFIGIGINCAQREFPSSLKRPATSLFLETGRREPPLDMMEDLLSSLKRHFTELPSEELPASAAPELCGRGELVSIFEGDPRRGKRVEGYVEGIGISGELQLRQINGKIKRIFSGE